MAQVQVPGQGHRQGSSAGAGAWVQTGLKCMCRGMGTDSDLVRGPGLKRAQTVGMDGLWRVWSFSQHGTF